MGIVKQIQSIVEGTFKRQSPKLVLPDGTYTNELTPTLVRNDHKENRNADRLMERHAKKAMSFLENYRLDFGPAHYNKLFEMIESIIHPIFWVEGNTPGCGVGPIIPSGENFYATRDKPLLFQWKLIDHLDRKAYTACKNFSSEAAKVYVKIRFNNVFSCPPSVCYEPEFIPTDNLRFILNKDIYLTSSLKEATSSYVRSKSADESHEVSVKYVLSMVDDGFVVDLKYIAKALEKDGVFDKYDVVARVTDQGKLSKIFHLHTEVPRSLEIAQEHIMDGFYESENLTLEEHVKKDSQDRELIRLADTGVKGAEIKTNTKTGEIYFEKTFSNRDKEIREINVKELWYDNKTDLLDDPILVGGHYFNDVVQHIAEHYKELEEIYKYKFNIC